MISEIRDVRVSNAVVGENGSPRFGVLDISGLPANAWQCRFMDMMMVVVVVVRKVRWQLY